MSKFKAQTEPTPQSSSDGNTEEKGQLLSQSAKTDNTKIYMQTTRKPSLSTSKGDNSGRTTADNSPTTEKIYTHAAIAKAVLTVLLNAGKIKRYEVRSADLTTVLKIRYEFDLDLWTEDLDLK